MNRDTSVVVREMFQERQGIRPRRRLCRLPGPRRLQGAGRTDGPDPRASGADVPGHPAPASGSIQPIGIGPRLRRTIRPQGMARAPPSEALLRPQVAGSGSRQTGQPACEVRRRGQASEAFVSSANFTEAAQTKNIEVGVLLRSHAFARRLTNHFESLAALSILKPIPLG